MAKIFSFLSIIWLIPELEEFYGKPKKIFSAR